jgi:3-oxoacyl-[acyl-carrier-protein] synthase II
VAIQRALDDARLDPADIDFVNAHGTGTPLNDAAEWAALVRVFGERAKQIPVEATKASTGHLMGAAGVIEAMSAALALMAREISPTPGGNSIDPTLGVDLVIDNARSMPRMRTALSTSFGFGGANSAVILGRWDAG